MADRERATSLENMLTIHSSFRVIRLYRALTRENRIQKSPIDIEFRPSIDIYAHRCLYPMISRFSESAAEKLRT